MLWLWRSLLWLCRFIRRWIVQSIKYLDELKAIETSETAYGLKHFVSQTENLKKESMAIEIGVATEIAMLYAFNHFNIDDSIAEGFASQYPNLAENQSLYEALMAKGGADMSGETLTGFISGIKGKVYEMQLTDSLNEQYDGWEFAISENATQPIWDIRGVSADGEEMLIQAKMGAVDYASEVHGKMLENPDVLFATSIEIQEKILDKSPELASQFIDVMQVSNIEFTTTITENVEQLIANHGADVFDGAGEFIPVIGEIVLGVKLLQEMSSVKHEYRGVNKSDQDKIKMLKAIMYISRYGVTTALITASVKAGAMIDLSTGGASMGAGTLIGLGVGIKMSSEINRKIKPHMYDLTLHIMDYTRDDLFYFQNKLAIDGIGRRLSDTHFLLKSEQPKMICG